MISEIFMRFPGGRDRALTLSYDDGVEQDIKLIEILNKYGIKATFNINSGLYTPKGTVFPEGRIHRRMTHEASVELYKNSPHEVAVHSFSHPFLDKIPPASVIDEIIKDRKNLEADYERPIRGMAYPIGAFNDAIVESLRQCGIVYSRTVISTKSFDIPTDWFRLPATCHHNDPDLMKLADNFVNYNVWGPPQMFYLWGHSYEFEEKNNWNVIEEFCEFMGGRDNVWYATNIEIYDYIQAYYRLEWSVDMDTVYNPTAYTIFIKYCTAQHPPKYISVKPGETLRITE